MADKVLDKIRKLLRLALSDNPGEAANALARAQQLMAKHRIDRAQLEEVDAETIQMWTDEPLELSFTIAAWRQAIGGAIAEVNDCLCLVSETRRYGTEGRQRGMFVAGRRSDFEAVALMYRWIVSEIERLAKRAYLRNNGVRAPTGQTVRLARGRKWLMSFRTGAAAEVERRIYREQEDQRLRLAADPKTSAALELRRGAVHEWAHENIEQRDPSARPPDVDPEAYEAGALAGRIMPLRERDDAAR